MDIAKRKVPCFAGIGSSKYVCNGIIPKEVFQEYIAPRLDLKALRAYLLTCRQNHQSYIRRAIAVRAGMGIDGTFLKDIHTLPYLSQVQVLNLSYCYVSRGAVKHIPRLKNLVTLNLDQCGILGAEGNFLGDEEAIIISRSSSMVNFSISNSSITGRGVLELVNNKTLRSLDISWAKIKSSGINNFKASQLTKVNLVGTTSEGFDLSENLNMKEIYIDGFGYVRQNMTKLPKNIEVLHIFGIGSRWGAVEVAEFEPLKDYKNLFEINLYSNGWGTDARSFINILKPIDNLKKIGLYGFNDISEAKALTENDDRFCIAQSRVVYIAGLCSPSMIFKERDAASW